jgi:thymidylate synthase (FAD)
MANNRVEVLDHGYVELIETWGSDERIVEAARMSTGKGFQGWGTGALKCQKLECGVLQPKGSSGMGGCYVCGTSLMVDTGDEKLLSYLYKNKHMTPFEMGGAVFEVKAPIVVFREWHRHRTQSYNEMSARYTPLPDENYVPSVERLMLNSKTNKQAGTMKGAEELTESGAIAVHHRMHLAYRASQHAYEEYLRLGVPKELARLVLPVGRYSRMRASANLRNWVQFLELRMDSHAQWEIRQYANRVCEALRSVFPRTMALFAGSDRCDPK